MDPNWFWGWNEELLRVLALQNDRANRMFHAAYMKGAVPAPIQLPRPGEQPAREPMPHKSDPGEVKQFFKGGL